MARAAERKKSSINIKHGMFIAFWILLIVCTCFAVSVQIVNYRKYVAQEAEIKAMVELEELRKQELTKSKDYYSSDAFVEKAAREQLGLVMPDEYLFYSDSKD